MFILKILDPILITLMFEHILYIYNNQNNCVWFPLLLTELIVSFGFDK